MSTPALVRLTAFKKIGVVIKALEKDGHKVVQVQTQGMKLHPTFKVYLPVQKDYFTSPNQTECGIGDMVVIKNMKYKLTPNIYTEIEDIYFQYGKAVCPITNRRCRGTNYISSEPETF